jgi:hypothetical protein
VLRWHREVQGIRVDGAKTIKVARTGCAARTSLASGANCSINLTYRPGALKRTSGRLVVNDNTIAGVHRVPLRAG